MKFVEVPSFSWVADALRAHGRGDTRLHCRLELYSMDTPTGPDEGTRARIEAAVGERSAEGMPASATMTSLGDLAEHQNQKLLVNLVCTLNASFPDYDFVSVSPGAFKKASSTAAVVSWVNQHLAELSVDPLAMERLWAAVNEQLPLDEAEVFTHPTDSDDPSVSAGSIWSFGFFVVHTASKRIVYLSCTAGSRLVRTPVGYRDSSSRLDDRASPAASPATSVGLEFAGGAAAAASSSSSSSAVYVGALAAPTALGGAAVSVGSDSLSAPRRAGARAGSSSTERTVSDGSGAGAFSSGAFTPGGGHGAFARGYPGPSAAALLFPGGDTEFQNRRRAGLAPSGSEEGVSMLGDGLERQRSAVADDDDDDDDMSGDGDGPRYTGDEGDDVEEDDRFERASGMKLSQEAGGDGMFDWEDVDA